MIGTGEQRSSDLLAWSARVLAGACFLILFFIAAPAHAEEPELEVDPVCAAAEEGRAECLALEAESGEEAEAALQGSGERGGFSPTDLASAYKLNTEAGEGKTIAIVIAFDNPNAEADLAVYRETYGLPPCTTANGCFKKVNHLGEESNYPEPRVSWAEETSLDLDMASAVCPKCKLLLVEAEDNFFSSLGVAEEMAVSLGATVVSNSWGGNEREKELEEGIVFHHPGIPITVSSGDAGQIAEWPAASPDVIAVGGTSLIKDPGTRGWVEDAWKGAGSGCSLYEPKPTWQKDTACKKRFIADVSAVADPQTPVSVYDSYGTAQSWLLFGGTSASAPIIAGVEALSSETMRKQGAEAFYNGTAGPLFDPTEGVNGVCTPPSEHRYYCHAELGFDGPTGNGTPNVTPSATPVVASAATEVLVTEAKLIGTVNPRGLETKYRFEYGLTTAYGNSVPVGEGSAGSGTSNVQVSSAIKSLEGEKTYHFRLVATNSKGTTYGEDRHLFTRGVNWAAEPAHLANYGKEGKETGQFIEPRNVAISPVSGNVFVTDWAPNNRVQVFDVEGKFVRQFGSTGKELGKFEAPYGITVDKHGHVWVVDWGNKRVEEFTETGTPIQVFSVTGIETGHPYGIAVDESENVWVTVPGENAAFEYDEKGEYIRQFYAGSFPQAITIDEDGNIWTSNNSENASRLEEHSKTGEYITSFAPSPGQVRLGSFGQLAVDPDGNIWVASFNDAIFLGKPAREFFSEVLVFSSTGVFEEAFGSKGEGEDQLQHAEGLALDPRGYIWLADTNHDRISKWGVPPFGVLSVATEAASSVSPGGATLNGSVNPGGFDATYQFEYGKTTSYGTLLPAGGEAIDPGYNSTKVSQAIAGLEPNTTYHFRVTATGLSTGHGEDKTFTTPRVVQSPTFTASYGSKGSGNGQFGETKGIAADSSGNVWVVDMSNRRVEEFNATGEYVRQFGSKGSGNGQFIDPRGIGIDPEGDVWVTDFEGGTIQQFNSKGEFVSRFEDPEGPAAVAFDAEGNLQVVASTGIVQRYSQAGKLLSQFGSEGFGNGELMEPNAIAIGADGRIWVHEPWNGRVQQFTAEGEFVSKFDTVAAGGMKMDSEGNLWVVDSTHHRVQEYRPEGEFVLQFGSEGSGEGQFKFPTDVTVDNKGHIWVTDTGNNRVQKWTQASSYPVLTGAVTFLTRTEATLNASVNPEGAETSYQFEYGTTEALGIAIPASAESVGSGTSPVQVSKSLNGLKTGTTYYYRVIATTKSGTIYGETRHFTTAAGAGAGAKWRIGGKTFTELKIEKELFKTSGSFTITYVSTPSLTFQCSESGSGTLTSSGPSEVHMALSCKAIGGCYFEGPVNFLVNGSFNSLYGSILTNLGTEGCPFSPGPELPNGTGSFEFGSKAQKLNVTALHTTSFGAHAVIIGGSSYWELTGAHAGEKLGVW